MRIHIFFCMVVWYAFCITQCVRQSLVVYIPVQSFRFCLSKLFLSLTLCFRFFRSQVCIDFSVPEVTLTKLSIPKQWAWGTAHWTDWSLRGLTSLRTSPSPWCRPSLCFRRRSASGGECVSVSLTLGHRARRLPIPSMEVHHATSSSGSWPQKRSRRLRYLLRRRIRKCRKVRNELLSLEGCY